jgi:hypothetical protein
MWAKKSVSDIIDEEKGRHYRPNRVREAMRHAYDAGYTHGQTGYGFQKRDAGRKGTQQYDAYYAGYEDGGDDSGKY